PTRRSSDLVTADRILAADDGDGPGDLAGIDKRLHARPNCGRTVIGPRRKERQKCERGGDDPGNTAKESRSHVRIPKRKRRTARTGVYASPRVFVIRIRSFDIHDSIPPTTLLPCRRNTLASAPL